MIALNLLNIEAIYSFRYWNTFIKFILKIPRTFATATRKRKKKSKQKYTKGTENYI